MDETGITSSGASTPESYELIIAISFVCTWGISSPDVAISGLGIGRARTGEKETQHTLFLCMPRQDTKLPEGDQARSIRPKHRLFGGVFP